MRIAIVDDEERCRDRVKEILEKYPWKEQINMEMFSCGEDFVKNNGYDIAFMDIEMKGMDGFETVRLYKENNENTIIIFLTTHTELSRKGYIVNAFRYIDKNEKEMEIEVNEALATIEAMESRNYIVSFHVLHMGEISLRTKDILFIETDKRNVIVHTKDRLYTSNRKIDEMEDELKERGFFRCDKSYLVNLENIDFIDKVNAYFKNGEKARVSIRKYPELKEKYLEYKYRFANS